VEAATTAIPTLTLELHGGKEGRFSVLLELLGKIQDGGGRDLSQSPALSADVTPRTWQRYSHTLAPMGVAVSQDGVLHLTQEGVSLLGTGSPIQLASILATRIRLFAETLGLLAGESMTVETLHAQLVSAYGLDWDTDANTRVLAGWRLWG
jgi:hypothetical protein